MPPLCVQNRCDANQTRSATQFTDPMERLEARRYLAAADFAHVTSRGTLGVAGDAGNNTIVVTIADGVATVTCDSDVLTFDAALVRRIRVDSGDGNDRVTVNAPRDASLFGDGGSDTLVGGAGDDSVDGGAGDDVLDGGGGTNYLAGGDGFDTADYSTRTSGVGYLLETQLPPEIDPNNQPLPSTESAGFARAFTNSDEPDFIGFFVERIIGTAHADQFEMGITFSSERVLDGRRR